MKHHHPTVLVILANGVEELEAVAPIDLLRRAGARVTTASLGEDPVVVSKNNIRIHADTSLSQINLDEHYDMLLLPGGPGVALLRADPRVLKAIANHHKAHRWIAAICAAPLLLNDAGLLNHTFYTAYPACADELDQIAHDQITAADKNILTGRGPGAAIHFGLLLVEKLFSKETSEKLAKEICL